MKSQEDLGLPADQELIELASSYLEKARELWPEMASGGQLLEPSPSVLADMVADFKSRHRTGTIRLEALQQFGQRRGWALDYARFSHENSNPRSVHDQLMLAINMAHRQGYFIPWTLVFADYARSATQGHRQAFQSVLKVISNSQSPVNVVYVDDFQRASRNEQDWWTLASHCKNRNISLFGVSDGFNLEGDDWDLRVSVYNLLSRVETKNKRNRVRRGMRGAADDVPLGRQPLGYARRVKRNAAGEIQHKANGQQKSERCIDPAKSAIVRRAFRMFVEERQSPYKIAATFNLERVDDHDGWTETAMKRLLTNPAYVGLFIWGRTTSVMDPETRKARKERAPWRQWKVQYQPDLAIVPKAWHRLARNELARPTRKLGSPRYTFRTASTLLTGLLVCGYCGHEIKLFRSTETQKSIACLEGMLGRRGCQLDSCKSLKMVENALLRYLREHLFTEACLADLLERCNGELTRLAEQPKVDLTELKKRKATVEAAVRRLMGRIAQCEDDGVYRAYEEAIASQQRDLQAVVQQIVEGERANEPPPLPLDLDQIGVYLRDLRGLLNQATPAAAAALRALFGRVKITHKRHSDGRRGAVWYAEFTPDLLRVLGIEAQQRNYPDSDSLHFLLTGKWISATPQVVELDRLPFSHSRIADDVYYRLHDLLVRSPRMTNAQIAKLAGCGETTVGRHRRRLELC